MTGKVMIKVVYVTIDNFIFQSLTIVVGEDYPASNLTLAE